MSAEVEVVRVPLQQPPLLSASTSDVESSMLSVDVEADLAAIIQMQHDRVERQRRALQARQQQSTSGVAADPYAPASSSQLRYASPLFSDSALARYREAGLGAAASALAGAAAYLPTRAASGPSSGETPQTRDHQLVSIRVPHTSAPAGSTRSRGHDDDDGGHNGDCANEDDAAVAAAMALEDGSMDIDHHEERRRQRAQPVDVYAEMDNQGRPSSPLFARPNRVAARAVAAEVREVGGPTTGRGDDDQNDAPLAADRASSVHPFLAGNNNNYPRSAASDSDGEGDDDLDGAEAEAAQETYRAFLAEVRRQHHEVLARQQAEKGTVPTRNGAVANGSAAVAPAGGTAAVWHNRYHSPPLATLYHQQKYGRPAQNGTSPLLALSAEKNAHAHGRTRLTYEQHLAQLGLRTPSSVGAAASSDQGNSPYLPHEYRHSAQKLPRGGRATAGLISAASWVPAGQNGGAAAAVAGPAAAATSSLGAGGQNGLRPPPLVSPYEYALEETDAETHVPGHRSSGGGVDGAGSRNQGTPTRTATATATTVASSSPVEPFADVLLHDSLQASQGTSPQRPQLTRSLPNAGAGSTPFHLIAPIYVAAAPGAPHDVAVAPTAKISPSSLIPELGTITPRSVPSGSVTVGSGPRSHHRLARTEVVAHPHSKSRPVVPVVSAAVPAHDASHNSHTHHYPNNTSHTSTSNHNNNNNNNNADSSSSMVAAPASTEEAADKGLAGVHHASTDTAVSGGGMTLMPAVEIVRHTPAPLRDRVDDDRLWQQQQVEPHDAHARATQRPAAHHHASVSRKGADRAALRRAVEDFWKPKRKRPQPSQCAAAGSLDCTPLSVTSPGGQTFASSAAAGCGAASGMPCEPFYRRSLIGSVLIDMAHEEREQSKRFLLPAHHTNHSSIERTAAAPTPAAAAATPSSGPEVKPSATPAASDNKKMFYYYGKGFRAL